MKKTVTTSDILGQNVAIVAESLYLINLLLLPGLAFLMLGFMYFKCEHKSNLGGCHLRQTFSASIWAGLLLLMVNGVVILAGGFQNPYVWVFVILYFTMVHSVLIFLGVIGLIKAMAGESFHYPFIGPSC